MALTKREQRKMDLEIIELVEAGEATIDSLTEHFDTNKKTIKQSLGRIEGRDKYAMFNGDGVISFVDEEAYDKWEAEQEEARKKPAVKKITNPQAQMVKKQHIVLTKTDTFATAQKRYNDKRDFRNQLKWQIASLQLTLAKHELELLQTALVSQFELNSIDELSQYENLDDLVAA